MAIQKNTVFYAIMICFFCCGFSLVSAVSFDVEDFVFSDGVLVVQNYTDIVWSGGELEDLGLVNVVLFEVDNLHNNESESSIVDNLTFVNLSNLVILNTSIDPSVLDNFSVLNVSVSLFDSVGLNDSDNVSKNYIDDNMELGSSLDEVNVAEEVDLSVYDPMYEYNNKAYYVV